MATPVTRTPTMQRGSRSATWVWTGRRVATCATPWGSRLRGCSWSWVGSGGVELETLFARDGDGYASYAYSDNAAGVTVGDLGVDRPAGFDVRYAVGVPVAGLFVFLGRVRDGGWLGGSAGVEVREHLA